MLILSLPEIQGFESVCRTDQTAKKKMVLRRHQYPSLREQKVNLSGKKVAGKSIDPEPDWTLDDLQKELAAIELKFNASPENDDDVYPLQHTSGSRGRAFSCRDLADVANFDRTSKPFVMRAFSDSDSDSADEDTAIENKDVNIRRIQSSSPLTDSDSESIESEDQGNQIEHVPHEIQLLGTTKVVEGSLFELERERMLRVQDEIREKMTLLRQEIEAESERSSSALLSVEKDEKAKREMSQRVDQQYQRKIAETRDTHLSEVLRDHQQKTQVEERRIKREAAIVEQRRREEEAKELKERQERAKEEANKAKQMSIKAAEEKERLEAIEAQRRAAAEAKKATFEAEKVSALKEAEQKATTEREKKMQDDHTPPSKQASLTKELKVKISPNAAIAEGERQSKVKEIEHHLQVLSSNPNVSKELKSKQLKISVRLRQVTGSLEHIRTKAGELLELLNDSRFPLDILYKIFAEKAVSQCETTSISLNTMALAMAHVIVLVTSQVPDAMDLILAQFNKACMFTVPKYILYTKGAFETEQSYYRAIGYIEDNGTLESSSSYLTRMEAYVTLYAAIIQTEIKGVNNHHGIKYGWTWMARFLKSIPPNRTTAKVLVAFLKISGFRLFRTYPKPFLKLLSIVQKHFLFKLKSQQDTGPSDVIFALESYLESREYEREPEESRLPETDYSKTFR